MNRTHFVSALALFALFATPTLAQKKADKATKPAAAVYKLDTAASTIKWKGTKAIGDAHDGAISLKSGEVTVTGNAVTAGTFTVDMNTITNNDLAGSPDYQAKLVGHLKSEDFFHTSKYPESVFKIVSVEKKSDTEHLVKGTLTMIGKTAPLEFPAVITVAGDKVTATANVKVDRTQWGLKYGSGKFFKNLGDKMINDHFELTLNLVAKK